MDLDPKPSTDVSRQTADLELYKRDGLLAGAVEYIQRRSSTTVDRFHSPVSDYHETTFGRRKAPHIPQAHLRTNGRDVSDSHVTTTNGAKHLRIENNLRGIRTVTCMHNSGAHRRATRRNRSYGALTNKTIAFSGRTGSGTPHQIPQHMRPNRVQTDWEHALLQATS